MPESYTSTMKEADFQEHTQFSPSKGVHAKPRDHHPVEKDGPSRNLSQFNFQQGSYNPRLSQGHISYQKWNGENQGSFFPFGRVDASLQSTSQRFIQSQNHMSSFNLEREDKNCSHPQSWEGVTDESAYKQEEGMALPSRVMPAGDMPSGFDPQQYNAWNVMYSQNMPGAYGNHMQHAVNTGYNRWDMSAWQDGHPFMEHTPYIPYGSGPMQMGPNHAPCDWRTQSTGTVADAFPHYYPEGYYPSGNSAVRQEANFSGVGESDSAAPPPFETYHHYQEPQVYGPPANQLLPGFGTPVIGAGRNRTLNKAAGPQDVASQRNYERLVNAGGQVEQRQLQGIPVNAPHVCQSANIVKKSRQEKIANNDSADQESSLHEEDVEIEGPQVKKSRECSEVDAYHLISGQSSGKFLPQTGVGSSLNVAETSALDGTPSSRNSSDVHYSAIHHPVKDNLSQTVSQGQESRLDQQHQSPDMVTRTFQRTGVQRTNDAKQAEISGGLMPGQALNRDHTRSISSMCSFENGAVPSQSNFFPGVRFVAGVQKLQQHRSNDGFIPGGYREEFSSTGFNSTAGTFQDQSWADLHMRQLRDQAQVASPPRVASLSKASTFQQSVYPGKASPSNAATQELRETQCKPCNIGEGPSSINTSSLRYQEANSEQFAYGNPSIVGRGEYIMADLHPEVEKQKTSYSASGVHPNHLQSRIQTPEIKRFGHSKAGPLETGAQFRGFSRPPSGKFYPPPPFHSHPLHLQRDGGTVINMQLEGETFPEAPASGNFESAMLTSGPKGLVPRPVNFQANGGYMIEGPTFYPVADGSGIMKRGAVLSEPAQVQNLPFSSLDPGNMSKQHPDNTLLYAHTPPKVLPKGIGSGTHYSSITVESQGSAGPTQVPRDNDLKASQPSGSPDPLSSGRSLRQENGDDYPLGHYSDIQTVSKEHSTLTDCEPVLEGKILDQIPHQAMKANLRAPPTLQPKKRKKSVPCLMPWHVITSQPKGQLPSISKAEVMWATATNRLADKDGGEVSNFRIFRAKSRLRLTTQLMQQIFSPLPNVLMHGKQPVNLECAVYNLTKSVLGEACRLIAGTERENDAAQNSAEMKIIASNEQTRTWNMAKEMAMTKLVERFIERVKRLDSELARFDRSMSMLQIRGKSHDFERLSIVHRLGKHHGPDFSINLLENRLVDAITNQGPSIRKTPPQKYVIAVPMPRTLPEGARCLSL